MVGGDHGRVKTEPESSVYTPPDPSLDGLNRSSRSLTPPHTPLILHIHLHRLLPHFRLLLLPLAHRSQHRQTLLTPDPSRTPTRHPPHSIQHIGMSATVPNLNNIAAWLNHAMHYKKVHRPVPLEEFIMVGEGMEEARTLVRRYKRGRWGRWVE